MNGLGAPSGQALLASLTEPADGGLGRSVTILRATERHPSPGAVGPASRLRRRYAAAYGCPKPNSLNRSRGWRMVSAAATTAAPAHTPSILSQVPRAQPRNAYTSALDARSRARTRKKKTKKDRK